MQCVEETYSLFENVFPVQHRTASFRTEYGKNIGFFLKTAYLEMEAHLAHHGYRASPISSPCLQAIYNSPY